jgi:hypothetical protein
VVIDVVMETKEAHMSHHRFGGRLVFDPRHIPAEWIRLADLNNRADGMETDEYKAVYRACCTGEIPSDKCLKYQTTQRDKRGPIYADPECVKRVVEASKAKAQEVVCKPRCVELTALRDAFERLLDRVEQMHVKIDRLM